MPRAYGEGTVFLVPLPRGGFGRGVIARISPKGGTLLGYFFAPRVNDPADATIADLRPEAAVARLRCGDLGLLKKQWPLLGPLPAWDRDKWPMPRFMRQDPMDKLPPSIIIYSDEDPSLIVAERASGEAEGLDRAALFGAGAVENRLDRLLNAGLS